MAYIGNQPADKYSTLSKQTITGDGTTGPYTLDYPAATAQDIEVFVNNVRQEPGVAYTVSGTALTMTGNVASDDDFYVVFQGRAVQTVVPADNTITTAMLKADSVTTAKIADDAVSAAKIADGAVDTAQLVDDAVTAAKLADDAVSDFSKVPSFYREGPLTGTFANIHWVNNATPDDEIWIDQFGTRLDVSNGNNGPSARARVRGVAHGDFFLQFYLGYSWGWSEIYMTEPSNMDESDCFYISNEPAGEKLFSVRNNNSNNDFTATFWDGSSSTTVHDTTGYAYGTRYTIWRNGTNLYFAINTTNYTVDTSSTEDFVFHTGSQSPFNVYLQGATGEAAF